MPYDFFEWAPDIVVLLAEHDVTPEEFEEIADILRTSITVA